MKYIKTYEYINLDYYNIGDYVIGNWGNNKLSKIIDISNTNAHTDRFKKYKVKTLIDDEKRIPKTLESDGTFLYHYIDDDQIERKATQEEIEIFDLTGHSKKYNL